jgi:hypothetical protein
VVRLNAEIENRKAALESTTHDIEKSVSVAGSSTVDLLADQLRQAKGKSLWMMD